MSVVYICEPTSISEAPPVNTVLISPTSHFAHFVIVRNNERDWLSIPQPYLVFPNELEYLFVGNCVVVSYYEELLSALSQPDRRRC